MRVKQQEQDILMGERAKQNGVAFSLFTLFLSLSFLAAVPVAMRLTNTDFSTLLENFFKICTSPSKLVTDYFGVGCLASTLLNAGLCGLACNLLILISRTRASSTTFAALSFIALLRAILCAKICTWQCLLPHLRLLSAIFFSAIHSVSM